MAAVAVPGAAEPREGHMYTTKERLGPGGRLAVSVSSFKAETSGVSITVEGIGVRSWNEYPNGFRWTQTISTNANKRGPLLPIPVDYVDGRPNDDTKPFYWTDAEEAAIPVVHRYPVATAARRRDGLLGRSIGTRSCRSTGSTGREYRYRHDARTVVLTRRCRRPHGAIEKGVPGLDL